MPHGPPLHSRREALRLGAALAAGAAGAGLLAACRAPATVPPTPGPEIVPLLLGSRRGRAERSGRLRLGFTAGAVEAVLLPLVTARLVAVDPRTALVYGDLAERAELPDPLTVAFTIREGVRFHPDGDGLAAALTAFDVSREFSTHASAGEFLFDAVVESVEASDQRTVVLRLRAPFALLFDFLADPARAAIAAEGTYESLSMRRGSGPFVPALREDRGWVLAANPLYHGADLPRLEAVSVTRFESQRELGEAFERGALDVWEQEAAEPIVPARSAAPRQRPSTHLRGLGLSMLARKGAAAVQFVAAFQDQRVRRAVALALDRSELLAAGGGQPSGPVGPAFAADALPAAELAAHALYQHDPGEARALLGAVGASGLAFRIQAPDGGPLEGLATLAASQLTAAGFVVRPETLPLAEFERRLRAGDFEATVLEIGPLASPDLGLRLHTSKGLDGGFSLWGYSNPPYDAAVSDALSAVDPAERARASRAAQRLLLDDVPAMLPLSAPVEYALVNPLVEGFEWDAYGFNERWLAARWTVGQPDD